MEHPKVMILIFFLPIDFVRIFKVKVEAEIKIGPSTMFRVIDI